MRIFTAIGMNRPVTYLILLLGAALLVAHAFTSPVWYDDAGHWLVAKAAAEGQGLCYPLSPTECDPASPYITMGPTLAWPAALWMKLFGDSMLGLRMLMVLLSVVGLWAYHRWASQVLSPAKGDWATLLILLNIQFLTYGSQFLGEPAMWLWVIAALWAQTAWIRKGFRGWGLPALVVLFGLLAIDTKLYVAPVWGLALGLYGLSRIVRGLRGGWMVMGQAAALTLLSLLWLVVQRGGWAATTEWLALRSDYSSEFLAFAPGEALRFIAFKPLIWMGAVAIWLKWRVRRDAVDGFLALFWLIQLLAFLLSAGYDRLGYGLIFIPALYLSEFVFLLAKSLWSNSKWGVVGLVLFGLLFVALFGQSTLPRLVQRFGDGEGANAAERSLGEWLDAREGSVYTFDQQIAPFISHSKELQLYPLTPSAASQCDTRMLSQMPPTSWLVVGEYGDTEFPHCIPWEEFEQQAQFGDKLHGYRVYRKVLRPSPL